MKKMLIVTLIAISALCVKNNINDFTGPMGYKFDYVRKLSVNEFEYKDTQTNIHYVVEKSNGQYIIKSPLFKNTNLELLITE